MAPKAAATKKGKVAKPAKAKKVKDPNAPKKPCGAYIWFCNEHRAKVKAAHSSWGVAEIGKHLGKEWGELDDEGKKKFYAKAEEDKGRYQKALEKYNATKKDEPKEEPKEEPKKEEEDEDEDDE